MQKFCKRIYIDHHHLTNSTSASYYIDIPNLSEISLSFVQKFCKRIYIDHHQLTNSTSAYNTMNKNVKKRPVFVKSSSLESKNYISIRKFHEQQSVQLKTIISRANKRVSSFQIQTFSYSRSTPQQKQNLCKNFSNHFAKVLQANIY